MNLRPNGATTAKMCRIPGYKNGVLVIQHILLNNRTTIKYPVIKLTE
jgi:hypothetical protein